jgi:hypothetical protein
MSSVARVAGVFGALALVACGLWTYIPWTGHGSWINNQTWGTRAIISFWDGQPDWRVPGAYSEQRSGVGWYPVDYFNPC